MNKYKRFITTVTTAFLVLLMPLLAHALTPSENSATVFPAEGNGNCSDYAENGVIMTITGDVTPGVTTIATNGAASANITFNADAKSLSFDSATVPIDFALVKKSRDIGIYIYQSGGTDNDSGITLHGSEIAGFALCYGLGNDAGPVNKPPELGAIGDKEVTLGDDLIEFTVTATDDIDLVDDTVTITASNVPNGANFNATTGLFTWPTSGPVGSTNVTFVASDGSLISSETISITVNDIPPEPLVLPNCQSLDTDTRGNPLLDNTGVICPDTGRSLVCNIELDRPFYGLVESDTCCICNNGTPSAGTALVECDPEILAGTSNADGNPSCLLTAADKAALVASGGLRETEVTTHLEFNNDPYYCYTSGGRRICYAY